MTAHRGMTTRAMMREQLTALLAITDDAELYAAFMTPSLCHIGTWVLIREKQEAGMTVREAAKLAREGL